MPSAQHATGDPRSNYDDVTFDPLTRGYTGGRRPPIYVDTVRGRPHIVEIPPTPEGSVSGKHTHQFAPRSHNRRNKQPVEIDDRYLSPFQIPAQVEKVSPWNYRVDSRGNWRAYERNTGEDLVWNIDLEDWETFFGDPDTHQRRPRERTWRTAEADFDQADEDLRRDRWSYGKDHLGYLHAFDPKAREDLIWNGLEWEEFYGHPHIKEDLHYYERH